MIELIRARSKVAAKPKDTGDLELNEKTPSAGWEPSRSATFTTGEGPFDYDFPRMIRFMGYGFCFAPIAVENPISVCGD